MRGVVPAHRAEPQPVGRRRKPYAVHRIVLKHHQRVEQLAQPGKLLDLGKPQMLVRQQPRLPGLRLPQQIQQRLPRRKLKPQRQRVDEQPHHPLDAGDLRRTARHRHAKHHVRATAQAAQQNTPGDLDQRVQRHARTPRLRPQRSAQLNPDSVLDPRRRNRAPVAGPRRKPRPLLKPGQHLPPRRPRRLPVLAGQIRQILPVRRHPRQRRAIAATPIDLQQLANQNRRRPAVHQQMMAAQQQPVPLLRKPDQRKPQKRRLRHIEALVALGRRDPLDARRLRRRRKPRQIRQPQPRLRPRHDHLHRSAQSVLQERRPQARVPLHHGGKRGLQPHHVEPTQQLQIELHRVDVRTARVVQRMEQQALLQRRQRQHVFELRVLPLQLLQLALRHSNQRQIARAAPAGPRLRGMLDQGLQRTEEARRQIAHLGLTQQRRRPPPVRHKPRPVRSLRGQRIER